MVLEHDLRTKMALLDSCSWIYLTIWSWYYFMYYSSLWTFRKITLVKSPIYLVKIEI